MFPDCKTDVAVDTDSIIEAWFYTSLTCPTGKLRRVNVIVLLEAAP